MLRRLAVFRGGFSLEAARRLRVQRPVLGVVFITVHANSAFDVIGRFMHMGLDLYNVVSALNAVLALEDA